jgi:hypothetical protein
MIVAYNQRQKYILLKMDKKINRIFVRVVVSP